jgi:hypothetical protein
MNYCPKAEWHIGHEMEPKEDKEKNVAGFRVHASQDAHVPGNSICPIWVMKEPYHKTPPRSVSL